MKLKLNLIAFFLGIASLCTISAQVSVTGELKAWHKITLEIEGPETSENDANNPFLNYKVTGIFTQGDLSYEIPGYYAADGDAANSGASSGNLWFVHFSPPTTGTWNYTVHFRSGTNVAISDDINAGDAVSPADNTSGQFSISETDKEYPDLRARGRLEYIGEHHLKFAGNGQWFIKAGADSPENLLAYDDFDNTPDYGGKRKSWSYHVQDWQDGDPTWKTSKGKGLIGAINYLSLKGMNSISFLTMNINGDDKNVYPYLTNSNFSRMDVSKLGQWEIVLSHAESKGMYLHFKTQETENELLLDNGALGTNRKLYYRELIARFGHHLALNWNLGEESGASFSNTNQNDAQRIACAQYFADNDPYHHNLVIHTAPNDYDKIYSPMLGDKSALTGASIQCHYGSVHNVTKTWIANSANAGKKWVVANDEQGGADIGVPSDGYIGALTKHDIRKQTLWGNFMAGGAGVEYYFGYQVEHSDMTCEDWRSRDDSWTYAKHALDFFNLYIPFWEMSNMDDISTADYVLGKAGEVYALYLKSGGTKTITLPSGNYTVDWFNPREGGLQKTNTKTISGGSNISIGAAPDNNDWAVLIREENFTHDGNQMDYVPCANQPTVLSSFNDFPKFSGISDFVPAYKDNARLCLAVNASEYKDKFAAAQATYNGSPGVFNLKLTTLKEYDGESTYRIKIDGVLVGEFQNPRTDEAGDLTTAEAVFPEIYISKGALIQVEFNTHSNGLIPEGGAFAYSRGRWKSLELIPMCLGTPGIPSEDEEEPIEDEGSQVWIEKDGIVVVDVESINGFEEKQWELNQGYGHMGSGYLQYVGPDYMSSLQTNVALSFKIQITTPGDYEFLWRPKQSSDAPAFDQWNDAWVDIQATHFYGLPNNTLTTKHELHGPTKVWVQNKNDAEFSWIVKAEYHYDGVKYNGKSLACNFSEPGTYTVVISGRSKYFNLDRFALAMDGKQSTAKSQIEESQIIAPSNFKLVESIEVSNTDLQLEVGSSETVSVNIVPANATNKELIWESSDPAIATVDKGVITAITTGVTAVTVRAVENGSINKTIAVEVIAPEQITEITYDNAGIVAYFADSEDTERGDGVKEKTVDGDPSTMWHTQWYTAQPVHPHEIRFDLQDTLALDRFVLVPRQDQWGPNGAIGKFDIFISNDSLNWGEADVSGELSWVQGYDTANMAIEEIREIYKVWKTVELENTVKGRFVRLVVYDEAQGKDKPMTSLAEIYFKADFGGVNINSEKELIAIGNETELEAEILPANVAGNFPITWNSSDNNVATVENGIVKGVSQGISFITASILDGLYSDTCIISVGIATDTLMGSSIPAPEMLVGDTLNLVIATAPENYSVELSSANPTIATIDNAGQLIAKGLGTTTVTASILNGRHSLEIPVNVLEEAISFSKERDTILVGSVYNVTYNTIPENSDLVWSSSQDLIASVINGTVIARYPGNVNIVASSKNGTLTDTLKLYVFQPTVNFDFSEKQMLESTSEQFLTTVYPDTCKVSWHTENAEIATVDENGLVNALTAGKTLISAEIKDGEYKALCVLEVLTPALSISDESKSLQTGTSYFISAQASPDTCTVTWTTADPSIATVTELGVINALKAGNTTVTASILDGSVLVNCDLTVFDPSFSFDNDKETIVLMNNQTLAYTSLPETETISWGSTDESIVTVSNGSITGKKTGTAKVYGSIINNTYSDTVLIEVIAPTVTISEDSIAIFPGDKVVLSASVNTNGFSIVWKSSDPLIASVTGGRVTALQAGQAVVTAETSDGAYAASCKVNVQTPTVTISEDSIYLEIGDEFLLSAVSFPDDESINWKAADRDIATVSNGLVSAIEVGTTEIIASTYYGAFSDTCVVVVSKAVGIDQNMSNDLILYPNPTSGKVFINTSEICPEVQVMNMEGKLLKYSKTDNNQMDISALDAGIYFIKIPNDDHTIIRRIVKY